MKKLVSALSLAVALALAAATSVAAAMPSAPAERGVPKVESEYASAYVYETVSLTSEYDGDAFAWYVNGAKIEGSDGKSDIEYTISPSLAATNVVFSVEYRYKSGTAEFSAAGQKTLYVSPWTPLALHALRAPSEAYAGDKLSLSALVYNPTGRKFTLPLVWSANGKQLSDLSVPAFTPALTEYSSALSSYLIPSSYVTNNSKPESASGAALELSCSLGSADDGMNISPATASVTVTTKPAPEPPAVKGDIGTVVVDCTINADVPVYKNMSLSGNTVGQAKAGTAAKYINYSDKAAKVIVAAASGETVTGWVDKTKVTVSTKNYTEKNDPSAAEKELFVAKKGYKSDTDYLIWTSLLYQKVNVFKKDASGAWKLVFYTTCSTGRNVTPTISGVFKYSAFRKKWWFDTYYVAPVMIFNGGHAFHSRTYLPDGSLLDSTLGRPASHGCVRLLQESIDWLAANIPLGTTVVVY